MKIDTFPKNTCAQLEAKRFRLRLIDPLFLFIVGPSESVRSTFGWLHLTDEEYALNEDYLVEIIAYDAGFLRSRWSAFVAWLRLG